MSQAMLYPLLYLGPKDAKRLPMGPREIVFEKGEQFDQPVAFVTEKDGRYIVSNHPKLYGWAPGTVLQPEGIVTRKEFDALLERVAALEGEQAAKTPTARKPRPEVTA